MGLSSRTDSKASEDENLETSLDVDVSLGPDLEESERSNRTISNLNSESKKVNYLDTFWPTFLSFILTVKRFSGFNFVDVISNSNFSASVQCYKTFFGGHL